MANNVNYKYDGTVTETLTARFGPADTYPAKPNTVYRPGDSVQILEITTSGGVKWAHLIDGTYIKMGQGSKAYVKYYEVDRRQTGNIDHTRSSKAPTIRQTSGTTIDNKTNKKNTRSDYATYSVGETVDAATSVPMGNEVNITGNNPVANASMRLFGLPYQFNPACDIRYNNVSSIVGREFVNKFFTDGPLMFITPGRARYTSDKDSQITAHSLISAAHDDLGPLKELISTARTKPLMFYEFEEDYTAYMRYVNMMCRTVAGFLELKDEILLGSRSVDFQTYDWRNYRWTDESYHSNTSVAVNKLVTSAKSVLNRLISTGNADVEQVSTSSSGTFPIQIDDGKSNGNIADLNQLGAKRQYVMFYVDPTTTCNESFSNSTSESDLQQKIDGLAAGARDFAFYAKSAGAEGAVDAVGNSVATLFGDGALNMGGPISNVFNKIISAGSAVVRGENIVLPEIYQNSTYSKDYQIQIHLKTPYGDKLAVYLDVIVPMLHLLALVLPKQSTANTYGSPFLIKAHVPGVFTCGLGIVTALQFDKARTEDAWSVDGLPMEVDVTMTIKDLYTKMSMSPSNEPLRFLNNSSLIEYLSNVAGVNLILPQFSKKISMMLNTGASAVKDIRGNIGSLFTDTIDRAFENFIKL